MLKEFLGSKTKLTGGEINEKKLRQAARLTSVYSEVRALDARVLPFEAETFDSVLANGILTCMQTNVPQAIREAARVLRPGGHFVCTVPTDQSDQHYYWTELLAKVGLGNQGNGIGGALPPI